MNREDTAKVVYLIANAFGGTTVNKPILEAWHLVLGDADGEQALEATLRLCRQDRQHAPRPGEVLAEIARMTDTTAPTVDAAVGFYIAGQWDRHPLVKRAAEAVYWDRREMPDKAKWDFRNLYESMLHDERTGTVRSDPALTRGEPSRLDIASVLPRLGSGSPS